MNNYNGSLEAVDCHIHSVRYDMAVNRQQRSLQCLKLPPQVTYDVVDTSNNCLSREKVASILPRPTIMGHWKLSIAIHTA
eukprot:scaffold2337_cov89-Skeletonema_dohrnii-CCMP3373.AAC.2